VGANAVSRAGAWRRQTPSVDASDMDCTETGAVARAVCCDVARHVSFCISLVRPTDPIGAAWYKDVWSVLTQSINELVRILAAQSHEQAAVLISVWILYENVRRF